MFMIMISAPSRPLTAIGRMMPRPLRAMMPKRECEPMPRSLRARASDHAWSRSSV